MQNLNRVINYYIRICKIMHMEASQLGRLGLKVQVTWVT